MRQAKHFLWTSPIVTGKEAVELGLATQAVPAGQLDAATDALARRIALMPTDLLLLTKRALHRAYDAAGFSNGVTAGIEYDALGHLSSSAQEFRAITSERGLKAALAWRDQPYGESVAE
jgi:enoyl-CoA hydratase